MGFPFTHSFSSPSAGITRITRTVIVPGLDYSGLRGKEQVTRAKSNSTTPIVPDKADQAITPGHRFPQNGRGPGSHRFRTSFLCAASGTRFPRRSASPDSLELDTIFFRLGRIIRRHGQDPGPRLRCAAAQTFICPCIPVNRGQNRPATPSALTASESRATTE
jgi:hypothetical protein